MRIVQPIWPMWRGRPRPRAAATNAARSSSNSFYGFCFLLLASVLPCAAQHGGGAAAGHGSGLSHASAPAHPSHSPGHNSSFIGGRNFRRSSRDLFPDSSLPFPFFGDAFDPDDIYSTGYPVASQPPPYVLQAASEMAGQAANFMGSPGQSEARNPSLSQPLLIELQNGRYVRVNTTAADGEAQDLTARERSQPPASARSSNRVLVADSAGPLMASASPPALPPVTLYFRDGRTEQVRDYTIANGILYASGDYYTDGYWNKKINLSALDLTRTLQANSANNVNFILPSSPNEVITRP